MDLMDRRRAAQRSAEASAGETADEMLERMREDLQAAPAETAAPKAVTQGSEFLSVSGASTSTVIGGAQAIAVVEGGSAPAGTVGASGTNKLSFAAMDLGDGAPGVRRVVVPETGNDERRAQQEESGEELRHPVVTPAALGCSA